MAEIFNRANYGKIYINLEKIMKERGFTKNSLSNAIGADNNLINRYCKSELSRIDLDVLARLCYSLECSPADLIKYKK